jgi:hypothetical protein
MIGATCTACAVRHGDVRTDGLARSSGPSNSRRQGDNPMTASPLRRVLLACTLAGLPTLPPLAAAQDRATKPIRLIAAFAPGGLAETSACAVAEKLGA